jgi:hypothetical protein
MDEVLRERLRRRLEALPDEQLYQVLDYIEFLESKYARRQAPEPTGLQRFAERLQDRLRARSVAPRLISGTVGALGVARKVVDGVTEAGRDLVRELVPDGAASHRGPEPRREVAALAPPVPPPAPAPRAPVPDAAGVADVPDLPHVPDPPDVPHVPDPPEVPDLPDLPDVRDEDAPDAPDAPDVPDREARGDRDQPGSTDRRRGGRSRPAP